MRAAIRETAGGDSLFERQVSDLTVAVVESAPNRSNRNLAQAAMGTVAHSFLLVADSITAGNDNTMCQAINAAAAHLQSRAQAQEFRLERGVHAGQVRDAQRARLQGRQVQQSGQCV